MFSKAKRFEPLAPIKCTNKTSKKQENEKPKTTSKLPPVLSKSEQNTRTKNNDDSQSCSSSLHSIKSFATPRPAKLPVKAPSSLRKITPMSKTKTQKEIIKAQEVEIRNKNETISEYNKEIEDYKMNISNLQNQIHGITKYNDVSKLSKKLSQLTVTNKNILVKECKKNRVIDEPIDDLKNKITELESHCCKLEEEMRNQQLELSSLEGLIIIRDTLCKDLQEKLTNKETCLEETRQQLEMVKGHHALALEANESIRREYKVELEALKIRLEEEKQSILNNCKVEQDNIKMNCNSTIELIKTQMMTDKLEAVQQLRQQLINKECEMKAKLEQLDEATHEKLRICEIQFEERSKNIQDHCDQQEKKIQYLEKETNDLKHKLNILDEQSVNLRKEINSIKNENELLSNEKSNLTNKLDKLNDDFKQKLIDFENEKNKLILEVDKALKEKNKFEMSLSVTRDIVQVLTLRLRESDNELEHLENEVKTLSNSKGALETELSTYKQTLNNTVMECNEYKEALVNILKSKAALTKEHNRIMEHNVTLIESLQNVEIEAYRELGTIKSELIEDVEMFRKESDSQIKMLKEEVEKKGMLLDLATEHATQAAAIGEQSRVLLGQAAEEIRRLEAENKRFQLEIQDQQSLVVELSLLRQENEELSMTVAKQSSIIDKLQKEAEKNYFKPKSPSVIRKSHKLGKENLQTVISPLRERNN
ncbi:hypothetical protein K1T71_004969 [Dendrolimus kikuchii]|uniref:Uncharacterized protein n=1 Tax=Dendrolimus kikuchii TaxID=765133 RepID=A0ACC1D788_9NEOP|nr:hypothetical protein K1T71_004969 [Dendrolimus kikuchii]